VGFAPDLPNSNGDGFPRSQLSRLGKELRSRRDTYTKVSYRRNLDRGLQSREKKNGWQLCPWDIGTMGHNHLLVRGGIESNEGQAYGVSNPFNRRFDNWSEGAADTPVLLADLRIASRGRGWVGSHSIPCFGRACFSRSSKEEIKQKSGPRRTVDPCSCQHTGADHSGGASHDVLGPSPLAMASHRVDRPISGKNHIYRQNFEEST
jgi:hypothetical protein